MIYNPLKLKELRLELGLTISECVHRMHEYGNKISYQHWRGWERVNEPGASYMRQICLVLGCEEKELFDE